MSRQLNLFPQTICFLGRMVKNNFHQFLLYIMGKSSIDSETGSFILILQYTAADNYFLSDLVNTTN